MMKKDEILANFGETESIWRKLDSKKLGAKQNLWEQCAELTLPYIFPKSGHNEMSTLNYPYNSIGTIAVEHLANKLAIQLLPPEGNFFRLMPYAEIMEKASVSIEGETQEQTNDRIMKTFQELDKALSKLEKDIILLISQQSLTNYIFEAVKLLIVTGNTLLYKEPKGGFKVYNPRNFCVERDYTGNVMTMILKDEINTKFLPEEFIKNEKKEGEKEESEDEEMFTCIFRISKNKWLAYQTVDGQILESTIMEYTNDNLPYIALRWTSIHNEDYGRGLVEKYLGDLRTLEGITQSIVESSSVMSKVIIGLKPASLTKASDLNNAKNGDIILGDLEKDITVFRVDKGTDFTVAYNLMTSLEQRLSKAFLMLNVRDSERTTSTEVRATINELDSALGGTYTVLAQELQLPLLKLLLNEAEPRALKISSPSIITGVNALSREKDIYNLDYFLSKLAIFGPEKIAEELDVKGYITEMAKAIGIDPNKILKSDASKEAEAQAMQQAQQEQMNQQAPQWQPM